MRILFLISLIVIPLYSIQAQVIDTSELDKLKNGEYKLAEGMLQVLFDDTTSQTFVQNEMRALNLDVKNLEFNNVILTIQNHPTDSIIRSLQDDESVKAVINESSHLITDGNESGQFNNLIFQNIGPEEFSEFQFRDSYQFVFVILKDNANLKNANRIIDEYSDLKISVLSEGRRAAVVLTTPENEEQVITQLENKPYVQSVAYMGVLE